MVAGAHVPRPLAGVDAREPPVANGVWVGGPAAPLLLLLPNGRVGAGRHAAVGPSAPGIVFLRRVPAVWKIGIK